MRVVSFQTTWVKCPCDGISSFLCLPLEQTYPGVLVVGVVVFVLALLLSPAMNNGACKLEPLVAVSGDCANRTKVATATVLCMSILVVSILGA